MKYKIISTEISGETLKTLVEFTFNDDSTSEIEVSNFMPSSKAEVLQNIVNRWISEQNKLDLPAQLDAVKTDVDTEIGISHTE